MVDDRFHEIVASKAVILSTYTLTPEPVKSGASGTVSMKLVARRAYFITLRVAAAIVTITTKTLIQILLSNRLNKRSNYQGI